jgi:hypothetical protein
LNGVADPAGLHFGGIITEGGYCFAAADVNVLAESYGTRAVVNYGGLKAV